MFIEQILKGHQRASDILLKRQNRDGSWTGEVELNPGPSAQVVMLYAALERDLPSKYASGISQYILRTQSKDGGWIPHLGAPSEVSLSVECYVALRLLGHSQEEPALVRAHTRIAALGGVSKANTWTQLYLGFLGIRDWARVAKIPIEILHAPSWLPVRMEHLSYWVNVITIPMALLGAVGPGPSIAMAVDLKSELNADQMGAIGTTQIERLIAKIFSTVLSSDRKNIGLKRAVGKAVTVIENFTESNGDFGGNTCTAMNVLMAYHILAKQNHDHPVQQAFYLERVEKGLQALLTYGHSVNDEWHFQTCQSHVWDTGFAMLALATPGEGMSRAAEWMRDRQILSTGGPWQQNVTEQPGGWCFGNRHDHYPVTDCTALGLMGLACSHPEKLSDGFQQDRNIRRGINWLLSMQHSEGGWSAYQKYERGSWLNKLLKFKDIPDALVDVPKADVSAKVIECLARWKNDDTRVKGALINARQFLLSKRETQGAANGLWRGNYGVNYIYGTSFAASALRALDERAGNDWAPQVRKFFLDTQQADGSWGESEISYDYPNLAGRGQSSIVQTSWALSGLISASEWNDREAHSAILKGTEYLLKEQKGDGSWSDPQFLGTVFPKIVYFRYEFYELYFPMIALGKASAFLSHSVHKNVATPVPAQMTSQVSAPISVDHRLEVLVSRTK